MNWSAIIGNTQLFGRGRGIWAMRIDLPYQQQLADKARRIYREAHYLHALIDEAHFTHAYCAALGLRGNWPAAPDTIQNAAELLAVFDTTQPEATAIHLYNAMLASEFAFEDGIPQPDARILLYIATAAREKRFLRYPEDRDALADAQFQSQMPGAMLHYLNQTRPVWRSFEAELRQEGAL